VEIGVKLDQVSVEVLEEPGKKGLFGLFGTKLAKVKVSYEDDPGNFTLSVFEYKKLTLAMSVDADFDLFSSRKTILRSNINWIRFRDSYWTKGEITLESIFPVFKQIWLWLRKLSDKDTDHSTLFEGYRNTSGKIHS
jgi:spoIIIJ-associated protein